MPPTILHSNVAFRWTLQNECFQPTLFDFAKSQRIPKHEHNNHSKRQELLQASHWLTKEKATENNWVA